MTQQRTWFITGVSSGFGYALTKKLLETGNTVIGTVRNKETVFQLLGEYPETFDCYQLDVRNVHEIHSVVKQAGAKHQTIDVLINNAGYGLFGAAEELSDEQIDQIIATNLTGSIQMIRAVLPVMRNQGFGRIIQVSSYGGQVAFPGNSLYHATKFGIEGFCEAVAQEVAPFNIELTIIEPGGARTEFRYGSAQVAESMPAYIGTPAHSFLAMLDPANGLAPGDPEKMADRMIESVELVPAPLRIMLGSQALTNTLDTLKKRIADYEQQAAVAASTDSSM